MKMFTKKQKDKMIENFKLANNDNAGDLKPVVKLFGGSACTWLLVDLDIETNTAFGLCDLGFGFPDRPGFPADFYGMHRRRPSQRPASSRAALERLAGTCFGYPRS